MAEGYRIIGAEMSPYSVKVRPYFRYKGIPHQWILRNAASQAEFEKHAKMPIIPLVVTPEGTGIQDSTPIIDHDRKAFSGAADPSSEPVTQFVSALIEEFGDEWGNKWMFHYRWARDVDQLASAGRIARMRGPKASEQEHAAFAGQVQARMVDRVWFVGSNAVTAPQIEAGFQDMLGLLNDASGETALSVWRTAGLRRFRSLGPILRAVDRSDLRRPDRRQRAARARLGAPHAVAEGRRRVRELDFAGANPDADPHQAGRQAVLAVDARQ